ncbi:type-F conjugative transfer system pilin assembly protein TrbC [Xenorhabdus bovienii]|uniref:type-F conjugative transfer system pilin assembly protein TrbC n=1 Tax=Xenorhabdus bovienii TaxID=40576 RepID=UPI0023B33245|nr:type-F conjugative transfer system pilin assembly protein TrbC [Xenorhabdus bovienii]
MKKLFITISLALTTNFVHAQEVAISPEMMKAAQSAVDHRVSNKEMSSFAENIAGYSKSSEFKQQQKDLQQQVFKTAGLDPDKPQQNERPELVKDQLVLFVSSSMPIHTLRNYARDLSKVGGVMVLRGAVGGISRIADTMKLSREILTVNQTCDTTSCKMWSTQILIDPVLFKQYDIKVVPALIFQPDMNINSYCDSLELMKKAETVIYGDASIAKMLEVMNRITPNKKYESLIKVIRGL